MSVEVLEVATIHESVVIGVDRLFPSCGARPIEPGIDGFSRIELERVEYLRCHMSVGDFLGSEEVRSESRSEEHDR